MNNWKSLWQKRTVNSEALHSSVPDNVFLELKRSAGFDVIDGGLTQDAFIKQYCWMKDKLSYNDAGGGIQFSTEKCI